MIMTEIQKPLLLCTLFSGTSGNYVRATWNRTKSWAAGWPGLVCRLYWPIYWPFSL